MSYYIKNLTIKNSLLNQCHVKVTHFVIRLKHGHNYHQLAYHEFIWGLFLSAEIKEQIYVIAVEINETKASPRQRLIDLQWNTG